MSTVPAPLPSGSKSEKIPHHPHEPNPHLSQNSFKLMIGALGIVYGDIGTSPLYALKASFALSSLSPTPLNVIGVISLFLWSLILMICVKYFMFVLPVNNKGEGGILALSARCAELKRNKKSFIIKLGIIGIALFIGDAIITPAISVLSAIEGISLITPVLSPYVIPCALVIIFLLFSFQYKGSGLIGAGFGYIMVLWFLTLALLGIYQIIQNPVILKALNPWYALTFLLNNKLFGFLALGGVMLVLTGCEALYADLGHFGKKPMQMGWYFFVFPALILNYLGQGSLVIHSPQFLENPFFYMVESSLLPYLVVFATLATIIASQAVISGLFSVTFQAIMLKYFPRMVIHHTSSSQMGQVYVPLMNKILFVLCVGVILLFQTAENLSKAYGLSIICTMLLTTVLLFMFTQIQKEGVYNQNKNKYFVIFGVFAFIEITFLICSMDKFFEGAWYAMFISGIFALGIKIWIKGDQLLTHHQSHVPLTIPLYLEKHSSPEAPKIPGVAVFFSKVPGTIPTSFEAHLRQNHYLHEKIIFLSIIIDPVPKVSPSEHYHMEEVLPNIYQFNIHYGFKETPDIHKIMRWAQEHHIIPSQMNTWFYLSRRICVLGRHKLLKRLELSIFKFLLKFSISGTEFYKIPHNKVIEIGLHYKL